MLSTRGRELLGQLIPWTINVKPPGKHTKENWNWEVLTKADRGLVLRDSSGVREEAAVFPRKCLGRHPSLPQPHPPSTLTGQIRGAGRRRKRRRRREGEKAGAVMFSAGYRCTSKGAQTRLAGLGRLTPANVSKAKTTTTPSIRTSTLNYRSSPCA